MANDVPAPQDAEKTGHSSPRPSVSSASTTSKHAETQSDSARVLPALDTASRRHRTRKHATRRRVKETLNARSEYTNSVDDGTAEHRINQYLIKQEIGRGSFGAVHLAIDQFNQEYAVKEFSKSRLRKRAQSHVLRHNLHGAKRSAGEGFNSPLHMHPSGNEESDKNPLYLIQEEIAIMKKLHHNNLVSLIEVLDDPTEDSLYMVMEMCKKGVIMKVGLGEETDPYDDERCRGWFRDLILAIEYLHAQGIVHRDIKPDNCLLTDGDVLKVVDFGVSEMFEKDSDMYTAKSAGSPAFLPPELCVVKHGDVSGKAADIWSMGVTLYCLRYGRIPFEKESIFELYESIRNQEVNLEGEKDEEFKDLMLKLLEKSPKERIKMPKLRSHPWVTRNGADPLISAERNTATIVGPPTEEEMNAAITKNMGHVFAVAKAVQKFKRLIEPATPTPMESILGKDVESHFVQPPLAMEEPDDSEFTDRSFKRPTPRKPPRRPHVQDPNANSPSTQEDGNSDALSSLQKDSVPPSRTRSEPAQLETSAAVSADPSRSHTHSPEVDTPSKQSLSEGTRGHARDPLMEEYPYLFIGPSTFSGHDRVRNLQAADTPVLPIDENTPYEPSDGVPIAAAPGDTDLVPIVSESPGAADIDIYETAYQEEIDRIKNRSDELRAPAPTLYLTRRIEGKSSGLANLLRQTTRETYLSGKAPAGPTGAVGDNATSGQDVASSSSAADKLIWAAKAAQAAGSSSPSTSKSESSQTDPLGSRGDATSQAAVPSMVGVTSASTTVLPTTTTATVTGDMGPSAADKSRSGLRNLLDRVRQGR